MALINCSCFSPSHKQKSRRSDLFHVIRAGLKPATRSLEDCCSIQLSYRTSFAAAKLIIFPQLRKSMAIIPHYNKYNTINWATTTRKNIVNG